MLNRFRTYNAWNVSKDGQEDVDQDWRANVAQFLATVSHRDAIALQSAPQPRSRKTPRGLLYVICQCIAFFLAQSSSAHGRKMA